MSVSVVVPTYNRGEAIGPMLDRLLASDRRGLGEVEVIVVDDGSHVPIATIVNTRQVPPGFTLKCVLQKNAGPAAARNLGFTISHGDIVIFIDDDILVPSNLLRQHVEAHVLNPGAVIFGGCVPSPNASDHMGRLLASLYASRPGCPRFTPVSVIASGQLSVERKCFPDRVYDSQLRTPAAEEFALSAQLAQRGTPALNATQIEAIHDQRFGISDVCEQQYKHGVGCAEAYCKLPDALVMDELQRIASANGPVRLYDPLATKIKKTVKAFLATPPMRGALIFACELNGRIVSNYNANARLLCLVIGVFFFAGYRQGLRLFGPGKNE